MSVTHLEYPRKSKLYCQGLLAGVNTALDYLYEDQDSPWVYKNTHKGIDHCIALLESLQGYYAEQSELGWPDYYDES
jgi:hypothetical protein